MSGTAFASLYYYVKEIVSLIIILYFKNVITIVSIIIIVITHLNNKNENSKTKIYIEHSHWREDQICVLRH